MSRRQKAARRSLTQRIPVGLCYEEEGLIVNAAGDYTKMLQILGAEEEKLAGLDLQVLEQKMGSLYDAIPGDMQFQFVEHNSLLTEESFPDNILICPEDVEPGLCGAADAYNEAVTQNADIGHNNMSHSLYLVLAVKADTVDDAVMRFRESQEDIRKAFFDIYGTQIRPLSMMERLALMHQMFTPGDESFGEVLDLYGDGTKDPDNLRYLRLSVRDLIAPKSWNTSPKLIDHSILNDGTKDRILARVLFISFIAKDAPASFFGELVNVSARMILSLVYEPVDTSVGLQAASRAVTENTRVTRQVIGETVADRKNRKELLLEEDREQNEESYFDKAALGLFKEAAAREEKVYSCTMTIVLYAEDMQTLNRDTSMLQRIASKSGSIIRVLEMEQCRGFQSALPLAQRFVDCERLIDARRLAALPPIDLQDAIRKDGMFCGLNADNDNLILHNRKNLAVPGGLIAGSAESGKTTQVKREIVNALLGSQDVIDVITADESYDGFAAKLDGEICLFPQTDIFAVREGYGLTRDDHHEKEKALTALFCAYAGDIRGKILTEKEEERIAGECQVLFAQLKEKDIRSAEQAITLMTSAILRYPVLSRLTLHWMENYGEPDEETHEKRLRIYKAGSVSEILMLTEHLWDQTIRDKHANLSHRIFIDPGDALLEQGQTADYLRRFVKNASLFRTVVTYTLTGSAGHQTSCPLSRSFDELVKSMGYVKLLNLGPLERRRYAGLLKIPDTMLNHITNTEPGKGLIITASGTLPFNDNSTELYPDSAFQMLFL